jgi:hypothetical protein
MPSQTQVRGTTSTPTTGSSTDPGTPAVTQTGGNAAAQDRLKKVSGPIGRVWNHVLGQPEGTNSATATVDQAMIRAYLDRRLGFAEGEFFRGAKLDGVAEKLATMLDTDGDGKVTWPEFAAFEGQIMGMLAPGSDKPGADAGALAGKEHGRVAGTDGKADVGELTAANTARVPKGTEHADLIGQLGARVAIDAADRDEGNKPIGQRSLSREEWTGAAAEIAGRK